MFRVSFGKKRIIGFGLAALAAVACVLVFLSVPGEEVVAAPGGGTCSDDPNVPSIYCCTYKEWTYYSNPQHTGAPVGSRTRFCCAGSTYSEGQQTQYCDWIVAGCPDDCPDCPNGAIETGSSNNCQA